MLFDPNVPSGSYYIKVYKASSDPAIRYIGFEYDSQASKTIYVFLNQPFELENIMGIYANKTETAEDLRDIGSTTLSLTKFISLYYKTIDAEGNIVRKELKNDIEKIYSASNALDVTTIFVADDKYYAVAENGAIEYLGSEEEYDALTPYVKGNYYTYDKKITDDIYASAFKQTFAEDTVVKSVVGTNFYESTTPNDKYYTF